MPIRETVVAKVIVRDINSPMMIENRMPENVNIVSVDKY
jgi:hypothetical protein